MTSADVRGAAGTGDETAKILADARTAINTTRANWPNPMIWIPSALDRLFAFAESVARDRARQEAENEQLREVLRAALPIVEYVSNGRGYVDVLKYPDATARRVNFTIHAVLAPCETVRILDGEK